MNYHRAGRNYDGVFFSPELCLHNERAQNRSLTRAKVTRVCPRDSTDIIFILWIIAVFLGDNVFGAKYRLRRLFFFSLIIIVFSKSVAAFYDRRRVRPMFVHASWIGVSLELLHHNNMSPTTGYTAEWSQKGFSKVMLQEPYETMHINMYVETKSFENPSALSRIRQNKRYWNRRRRVFDTDPTGRCAVVSGGRGLGYSTTTTDKIIVVCHIKNCFGEAIKVSKTRDIIVWIYRVLDDKKRVMSTFSVRFILAKKLFCTFKLSFSLSLSLCSLLAFFIITAHLQYAFEF